MWLSLSSMTDSRSCPMSNPSHTSSDRFAQDRRATGSQYWLRSIRWLCSTGMRSSRRSRATGIHRHRPLSICSRCCAQSQTSSYPMNDGTRRSSMKSSTYSVSRTDSQPLKATDRSDAKRSGSDPRPSRPRVSSPAQRPIDQSRCLQEPGKLLRLLRVLRRRLPGSLLPALMPARCTR